MDYKIRCYPSHVVLRVGLVGAAAQLANCIVSPPNRIGSTPFGRHCCARNLILKQKPNFPNAQNIVLYKCVRGFPYLVVHGNCTRGNQSKKGR